MGGDWRQRKRGRALTREVSANFTAALANYFGSGPTDINASRAAHANYLSALQDNGVIVDVLPGLDEHPDCMFVEDAAIVVNNAVVIPFMGHPSREGEQKAVSEFLGETLEIHQMPEGATMDGGDVIFFDDRFLIGRSTRTNSKGIDFFQGVAREQGFSSMVFEIPSSTLHLTTVCSSPKPGMLIVAEGHLVPEQFTSLVDEGVQILWVPNEESYAANVIGFESGNVIISANYPVTKRVLEDAGFTTQSVDMTHIRAADGSLTCCSIFYQ